MLVAVERSELEDIALSSVSRNATQRPLDKVRVDGAVLLFQYSK
jgi:hypothetical protein